MKRYFVFIFLMTALLVNGCAVIPSWHKKGVSHEDAENVLSQCKFQIGLAKVNHDERAELISECMKSQGYRFQKELYPRSL